MRKELLAQAVELTRRCLERYWQGDGTFVLDRCAEDVLWIASAQSQYLEGIEAVREDCRQTLPALQRCCLMAQEFAVVQNAGNACTIVGRYFVTTDKSEDYFLQVQQRCTFVWEAVRGRLVIRHIHVSNPLGELKADEGSTVVGQMGRMANQYLLRHYRQMADARRIQTADQKEGVTYFFSPAEILMAAADRRFCTVYPVRGEAVSARMSITEFAKAAGEGFLVVHRSYVVNTAYISQVRPCCAVLVDGREIPIPAKRFREVRDRILAYYSTLDEGQERM